jgi:hypothetical protein
MAGRYFQCATLLAGLRIEQNLASLRAKSQLALESVRNGGIMLFHGHALQPNGAGGPVERRLARKAP